MVDILAGVVDQIEAHGDGGLAPGQFGNGEDAVGVSAAHADKVQIGRLVGGIDVGLGAVFSAAVEGTLQIDIIAQGNLVIGDGADVPVELLHTVGGLGIGEIDARDGDGISVGIEDILTVEQIAGGGGHAVGGVEGNSLDDGEDGLTVGVGLAGANMGLGNLLAVDGLVDVVAGIQLIGLHGDLVGDAAELVGIVHFGLGAGVEGEIAADGVHHIGAGAGVGKAVCHLAEGDVQGIGVVGHGHIEVFGVADQTAQNILHHIHIPAVSAETAVGQVEADGIEAVHLSGQSLGQVVVLQDPLSPAVVDIGGRTGDGLIDGIGVIPGVIVGVVLLGSDLAVIVGGSAVGHKDHIQLAAGGVVVVVLALDACHGLGGLTKGIVIVGVAAVDACGDDVTLFVSDLQTIGDAAALLAGGVIGLLEAGELGVVKGGLCGIIVGHACENGVDGVDIAGGTAFLTGEGDEGEGVVLVAIEQDIGKFGGGIHGDVQLGGAVNAVCGDLLVVLGGHGFAGAHAVEPVHAPAHGVGHIDHQHYIHIAGLGHAGNGQLHLSHAGVLIVQAGGGLVPAHGAGVRELGDVADTLVRQMGVGIAADAHEDGVDDMTVIADLHGVNAGLGQIHSFGVENQILSADHLGGGIVIGDGGLDGGEIGGDIQRGVQKLGGRDVDTRGCFVRNGNGDFAQFHDTVLHGGDIGAGIVTVECFVPGQGDAAVAPIGLGGIAVVLVGHPDGAGVIDLLQNLLSGELAGGIGVGTADLQCGIACGLVGGVLLVGIDVNALSDVFVQTGSIMDGAVVGDGGQIKVVLRRVPFEVDLSLVVDNIDLPNGGVRTISIHLDCVDLELTGTRFVGVDIPVDQIVRDTIDLAVDAALVPEPELRHAAGTDGLDPGGTGGAVGVEEVVASCGGTGGGDDKALIAGFGSGHGRDLLVCGFGDLDPVQCGGSGGKGHCGQHTGQHAHGHKQSTEFVEQFSGFHKNLPPFDAVKTRRSGRKST